MNKTCSFVWFYSFDPNTGTLMIFSQLRSDCLLGTAGGKAEGKETPIEAARREIWEELGLPLEYTHWKIIPKLVPLAEFERGEYKIHSFGCPLTTKQFRKFLSKINSNPSEVTGTLVFCLDSKEQYENMLSHNFSGTAKGEIANIITLHSGLSWM